MSLGAIRAGRGEVELGLNQTMLELGLVSARNKLQSFASRVTAFGSLLAGGGIAAALTSIPVGMIFAEYEQQLANLRAATNPSIEQFGIMREAIEKIARAAGESPADVAMAFTELAKAGVDIGTILNGAGEAAVIFGRVSGMSIRETAVILADNLSVFRHDGLSAMQVATMLSRAADASSVSLRDVSEAVNTAGSTLALLNQDLATTSTLIGILGNWGVKGAEAGTALKTFFLRLATGSDGAGDAMARMGLVVRDGAGNMLPAVEIIRRLGEATRDMAIPDRDRAFSHLAGFRGIRALSVLVQEGTAGFEAFQTRMGQSLNIQQRFAIMTDTLSGAFRKMWVAIQLAAIKIGDILLPAIRGVMAGVQGLFGVLEVIATDNPEIIRGFFLAAIGLTAWGVSLVVVGKALEMLALAMSPFLAMLSVMQSMVFYATSSVTAFAVSVYVRGVSAFNLMATAARGAVIALGYFGYGLLLASIMAAEFVAYAIRGLVVGLYSFLSAMLRVSYVAGYVFELIGLAAFALIGPLNGIFESVVQIAILGIELLGRATISMLGTINTSLTAMVGVASFALENIGIAFISLSSWLVSGIVSIFDPMGRWFLALFMPLTDLFVAFIGNVTSIIPHAFAVVSFSFELIGRAAISLLGPFNSLLESMARLAGLGFELIGRAAIALVISIDVLLSSMVNLISSGIMLLGGAVISLISWILNLNIVTVAMVAIETAMSAVSAIASISVAGLSGVFAAAASVGNFLVFTLGLYKVALWAITFAQVVATSGLSLLAGVMLTLAMATATVVGLFLAVTGAAALFVGLGGSFAAIADWLEVIDDVIEFLADSFYAFIDAVMDSPIGTAISWINDVALELWNSFGLLYDSVVGFLVTSGLMEVVETTLYAIAGAAAVVAAMIGIAAYGVYLFFQEFSVRDVFAFINGQIMDFHNRLNSIAMMIRPTIIALLQLFRTMFEYFIVIGQSTIGNFTFLFVNAAQSIARQMTTWFDFVFASISTSIATVRDRFMEMIGRVANDVVVIWEAMQNAFSAGNWRMLWDIAVISFQIAWHEISAFAVDVFFAWRDALVDTFNATSILIQNIFTTLWANIRSGFLTMLADVIGGLGVGEIAGLFARLGIDVGPVAQIAQELRGQALEARRVAGNENRARNNAQEAQGGVDEMVRWFRDQARAVENEMAGQELRNELDQIAMQAWFDAQVAMVQQDIAGQVNRRNFGEGNEVAAMGAHSIGTFSADVARGFLGVGETHQQRAARLMAQQLQQINAVVDLLRQILARQFGWM